MITDRVGERVRVEWPDHPTHRQVGTVVRAHRPDMLTVALDLDGTTRPYKARQLVRVRRVVTYVDWKEGDET